MSAKKGLLRTSSVKSNERVDGARKSHVEEAALLVFYLAEVIPEDSKEHPTRVNQGVGTL